jgi:hypothetical protein
MPLLPEFSVLIPLEAHRGHAVRCVRGWAEEQVFPRDRFEIVIASPTGHPKAELEEIRRLLGPQDRLLELDHDHDIALCALAAESARGDVLFFTESHCLPEPETLARADDVARLHPEWAGFSCRSLPITDNLLSKIEAESYGRDIEFGMTEHPWRKVLDQCFVVRRSAYFQAGGFDPAFGHFAEWLLAARMHALGLEVGYAPEVLIHHVYIGRFDEWCEFTADFVAGQMAYLAREPGDPLRSMFDEVPEWSGRLESERDVARRVCRMLLLDLRHRRLSSLRHWHWRLLGAWLARAVAGHAAELTHARLRRVAARVALEVDLIRRDQSRAEEHLASCGAAIASVERSRFVRRWAREHVRNGSRRPRDSDPSFASDGVWEPGRPESPGVGFHVGSGDDNGSRWSEPAAYVELPLAAGGYTITLNWRFRPAASDERHLRFYLNERPLPSRNVAVRPDHVELRVDVPETSAPPRLGWVCAPHRVGGDDRPLGLPVVSLAWSRRERTPYGGEVAAAEAAVRS